QSAEQVHLLDYPDHHFFTERNFEEIRQVLKDWDNDCVIVTTEKDATRLYLHKKQMANIPVHVIVLPVEVAFLLGQQQQFDSLVRTFVTEQQEKFVSAD
ncbi:MAG: tetraacyldisaccharide 4'-kinase, partial [Chitinophagaceae bacterium]|nr:tetraacyldisaccharide 4'-kinase [Chitinophagaceae bacterium]